MAFTILKRVFLSRATTNPLLLSQRSRFSTSRAPAFVDHDGARSVTDRLQLSPLFQDNGEHDMKECRIELVDDSTWNVSSSLANAWRDSNEVAALRVSHCRDHNDKKDAALMVDPDFDEIEDLRIRGNLFYKLDRGSKEYEEYKFDFHGSKYKRNERERRASKEIRKKEDSNRALASIVETASKKDSIREKETNSAKEACIIREMNKSTNSDSWIHEVGDATTMKKKRNPTFNQLTAPYHEPFCLDVYISTASVRASIIHRATSNVVAVAHSISKDMKFDFGSTKNKNACASVGKVLAQRALADDIHNVVYTPRKGEKLEGKLQIVVESIIDGGVNVKVKLKQTRFKQAKHHQHRLR